MRSEDHLTAKEKADARRIFEGKVQDVTACIFCGGIHARVANLPQQRQPCPRLKHIVWHVDGTALDVEYWPNGIWESDVVFPSDVYDDDDDPDLDDNSDDGPDE